MSVETNSNNPIIGYDSIIQLDGISVISSTVSKRPVENMWSPSTSEAWEGEDLVGFGAPITSIEVLNPNNAEVDYFGIARTNLSQIGYEITIYAWDGAFWNIINPLFLPTSDSSVFIELDQTYTNSKFLFELSIVGEDLPAPIIGHMKAGKKLVLQRRDYSGVNPPISNKVMRTGLKSENGNYLGQVVKSKFQSGRISQPNNTPEFVRLQVSNFNNHINGTPFNEGAAADTFFYLWRPGDYPDEVLYCWAQGGIDYTNQTGDSLGGMVDWSLDFMAYKNG